MALNKNIYKSGLYSLIIQLVIGLICLIGIFYKLSNENKILNEILTLETIVQFIEFCFYFWLVLNFSNITINVTLIRYLDWFITTPTMLLSLICFFIFNEKKQNNEDTTKLSVYSIIENNYDTIIRALILNLIMLFFGFLGEINITKKMTSFIVGTIALCWSFYIIYYNFVGNNLINQIVFWFNFVLWSGYGIAYLKSYNFKNIIYNILDVFSKNINGLLILFYILYLNNFSFSNLTIY
tara:strand:- start:4060 stop:4776 length:717 start_codon:yes stop_codon:yes gene_type:complete